MKKLFAFTAALLLAGTVAAGELALTTKGISIKKGDIDLVMTYPAIDNAGKAVNGKLKLDGGKAVLDYGEGRSMTCSVTKDGVEFSAVGGEKLRYVSEIPLPTTWGGKFQWRAGKVRRLIKGAESGTLPPQAQGKNWCLYDGIGDTLSLGNQKNAVTFDFFMHWLLKDDRVWNWDRLAIRCMFGLKNGKGKFKISFSENLPLTGKEKVKLTPKGVAFKQGAFDSTLAWPVYFYNTKKVIKPSQVTISPDGSRAELDYGQGRKVNFILQNDTLIYRYNDSAGKLAAESRPCVEMFLSTIFTENGGAWKFLNPHKSAKGMAESVFPRQKADQWFSFAGAADGCLVTTANGKGDSMLVKCPQTIYYMKDWRLWGKFWFSLTFFPRIQNNESKVTLTFTKGKAAKVIDRYGQFINVDFPEKVRNEAELKADIAADEAYYASLPKNKRTFWGGLPGSKEKYGLTATGFFHLEKVAALNNRLVLVDPEGNLYFHIGLSGLMPGNEFTCVTGREDIYEELPPDKGNMKPATWHISGKRAVSFYLANYIRKFGSYHPVKWQKQMVDRAKTWGFNSYGTFMTVHGNNDKLGFGYTACIERYANRQPFHLICPSFIDPYDPYNYPLLEKDFKAQTKRFMKSPMLIGYFTENERSYNIVVPAILATDKAIPAKRVFAEMMKERYQGNISKFNAAWNVSCDSFDDLAVKAIRPGTSSEAENDLAAFEMKFFDDYYKLICGTLRKIDPDHLLLGERFLIAQTYNDAAVKAIGKYSDIFSVNYYTDEYDPAEIERFAKISGKPLLLSEWSFGSPSQGLFGCRNKANDDERGKAYSRYVENAAASPYVVGIQWMNLLDESNTGRGFTTTNGERFNMGFLNVCDRPFKKLINHASKSNSKVYDLMQKKVKPVAVLAAQNAHAETKILGIGKVKPGYPVNALRDKYPGRPGEVINRSVAGRNPQKSDRADMICGWDEKYLYILLTVADDTPACNTHKQAMWMGDCVEVFYGAGVNLQGKMRSSDRQLGIRVNTDPNRQYRWQCNGGDVSTKSKVKSFVRIASDRKSYSMELALPWSEIRVKPRTGLRFGFDIAINFSGKTNNEQANKLVWNGLEENYFRRSLWGTGVLED